MRAVLLCVGTRTKGSFVGWSDLALFFDFWKTTHFCWSGIFLGTQFQNIANLGRARAAKFAFSKNQRDLKNQYFFYKLVDTFLIHQRTICKKKIWNFFFNIQALKIRVQGFRRKITRNYQVLERKKNHQNLTQYVRRCDHETSVLRNWCHQNPNFSAGAKISIRFCSVKSSTPVL